MFRPLMTAAARVARWVAAVLLAWVPASGSAKDASLGERDLNKTITCGVSESFFPYQYRDTDGQLKGFAIEVTDAVARVMDLRIRQVGVPNTEMTDALRNGRIDAIEFWGETPARRSFADFSVPIARFETVVVVRQGDARIRRVDDLKGRRVAVGQHGTVGERYLLEQQPAAIPVYTETSEEYLRLLAAGKCDAAVMSRITAYSMIDRFKLRDLQVLDDKVQGYDVRYCFTVRKGDSLLLARLNEGLAILHRTGRFDDIYHQWFGRYEARTFTPVQVVSYVAVALALGCVAATWGFLRQRTLLRRIARQAAELAEQRSLLAAMYDNHPLATVVLEIPAGGTPLLVSLNGEAGRLFALDPAAPPGCRLEDLPVSADLRAYFEEVIRRWRATTRPGQWETRLPATQQLLETTLVPLGSGASGARRLCVLSADVTKRRLMDQEIAHSRRLRALGELVGGIAHEFNNLLTPIIGTTNLLQIDRIADRPLQASLGVIYQAAKRAAELTRRLLTFGRKADERTQPVRIAEAVSNCFALFQPTIDRRIVWESQVPANLPPILFNPVDLNQIVFNLVINGRDTLLEKLAHAGGAAWTPRLRVSVEELPATAVLLRSGALGKVLAAWQHLTVEDNGLGIRPEIIERIFEPFFTTKDVGQGSGLGLATVWHLATEAGGEVTVESKVGEGTKFHVMLPRWQGDSVPPVVNGWPAGPPAAGKSRRILLVEDEPLVARISIAVLERLGHSVTHLLDGAEAWARFSSNGGDYDLLLLDVNMPRMSGVDLIRRVRGTRFAGRIVVMSGRVSEEDRHTLKSLDVDYILAKPFTPAELAEALHGAKGAATNHPLEPAAAAALS
ncbi:MAG TPA: transporter substrate-binding domain-containing protein [Opitutaceae bacterium]|nr:transporter substrate-binding domain-containing protein [Opitutaceae bacterium]